MALRTPSWLQGAKTPAENDRLVIDGLLALPGVVGPDDFKVTPVSGRTISVDKGSAFVPGTIRSNQGVYHCVNDAPVSLTLATPDATNTRIDSIVLVVRDAEVEGSSNLAEVIAVTGTPSSDPQAPPIPSNSALLAKVTVTANAAAITSGQILDTRVDRATAIGGTIPCTSVTRPLNPTAGQEIYELDTGFKRIWSAAGQWKVTADTGMLPTVFNPPRAYAYQTSTQAIENAQYEKLNWHAAKWDTNTMFSSTVNPSRLTIKTAGFYTIQGQFAFTTADTGLRRAAIMLNGGLSAINETYNTTAADTYLQVSLEARLAVGNYVELAIYHTAGNTLNTNAGSPGNNWLSVRWVAPY